MAFSFNWENRVDGQDYVMADDVNNLALGIKASGDYTDAHISNQSNPHGVTKTQLGLGNVDNTSDANKPVSAAQQAAINAMGALKIDKTSIVNNLTTSGTDKVLSAEQGKKIWNDVDFPVTNSVINSDFSNGAIGWASVASTLSVANNVLTVVGTGTTYSFAAVSQNISPAMTVGHKYYLAAKVKAKTASVVNMRLWADNVNLKAILSPVVNTEYSLSDIFTYTGSLSQVRVYLNAPSVAEAAGATMEVKYIPLIDLTAAFGAGNEPTAAQMDDILAYYENSWFNGTANIANNSKILPYLLAQIRRLTTAVVASGGTL